MNRFSHIYVEDGAREYALTQRILDKFAASKVIPIRNYKRVFNRPRQQYLIQKKTPKLILAIKKPPYLYRGSEQCQSFGNKNFFYATIALNCVFDCAYCYLKGMFDSANIVLFVNTDEFEAGALKAISDRPDRSKDLLVSLSYDTDLLALEKHTGLCAGWVAFARRTPDLSIEIRTKSASFDAMDSITPSDSVVFAWSLSPPAVSKQYERGAPSPQIRLESAKRAISLGWPVRLCFDPILPTPNWRAAYGDLIQRTFATIDPNRIVDVAMGPFRMEAEHLKMAKKRGLGGAFFEKPAEPDWNDVRDFMLTELAPFLRRSQIHDFP